MLITKVEALVLVNTSVFVRVETDAGVIGYGECSPMRANVIAPLVREVVGPMAVGQDPTRLDWLTEHLFGATYKIAGQSVAIAISGVMLACIDAAGKALGVPAWQLLGGKHRDTIPVYASSMRRHTTADEEADDLARLVDAYGFRGVKVKVGQRMGKDTDASPGRSEAVVKACRARMGDEIAIMCDANGAYSAPRAILLGRRLQEHGVFHFEEPCPYRDDTATAQVAAALDIPVAGGEQEWDLLRFRTLLERGVVDTIQPDVIKVGGLWAARKIGVLAEAFGAPVTQHNTQPTLGTVAMLHFAATCPACYTMQEFALAAITGEHHLHGLMQEPKLVAEDGCLRVPDGPGLGVVLDEGRLAELRTA